MVSGILDAWASALVVALSLSRIGTGVVAVVCGISVCARGASHGFELGMLAGSTQGVDINYKISGGRWSIGVPEVSREGRTCTPQVGC